MRFTKRRNKVERRIVGRLRPFFDRLEVRTAMSGSTTDSNFGFGFGFGSGFGSSGQADSPSPTSPLAIASTSPATSASLTSSPTSLTVTFNKPLNGFSLGIADFELIQVNPDGSNLSSGSTPISLAESLDFSNPDGDQIDLALNHPLVAGHYQLILLSSSQLAGTDGSQVASIGQDQVVSSFTIAPVVTEPSAPVSLGTVGSTIISQSGNLDLQANPGAVDRYRLTLGPGHRWSLGLSVTSLGNGNPLDTTLSLFDDQGELIATSSTGLVNDPGDPFLFAGLNPGTYEVGISARGNVPEANGTYDPTVTSLTTQPSGGDFQLQAVADVADAPTQVLGMRLDRADPSSTVPTGLTIQFSGALQIASLEYQTEPPLKLVDQDGAAWGVTTVGYDPSQGQLQVVFDQALPAGTYTLELTGSTSLLDLADSVPVATGLAAGELARFPISVSPTLTTGDLGPVYPGIGASSLTSPLTVGTQSSTTRQFVVIEGGVYAIEGVNPSSGVSYTLTSASGTQLANGPQASASGSVDVTLSAGVYTLNFTNPSDQSVEIPLSIVHKVTEFSQLLDGGIAQGAALNLRLVTPQANFGVGATDSSSSTVGGTTGVVAGPPSAILPTDSSSSRDTNVSGSSVAVGPTTQGGTAVGVLLFILGPVGLPSSQSSQISVVGSTASGGSLALASNSTGLTPGLIGIPESSSFGARIEPGLGLADEPVIGPVESGPETQRISSTDAGLLARPTQSRRADEQSLAGAEWISRLVANTLGWFGEREATPSEPVTELSTIASLEVKVGVVPIEDEPRVESASLGSPIGVTAMVIAMAYHYRKRLFSRRPRRPVAFSAVEPTRRKFLAGPHRTLPIKSRTD